MTWGSLDLSVDYKISSMLSMLLKSRIPVITIPFDKIPDRDFTIVFSENDHGLTANVSSLMDTFTVKV